MINSEHVFTLELTALPDDDDEKLPGYSTPGFIIFTIHSIDMSPTANYRYDVEVHAYGGSAYWIGEGVGFDYWFDYYVELEQPGTYKINGLVGTYYRGDMYTTDDDEDWNFKKCSYYHGAV